VKQNLLTQSSSDWMDGSLHADLQHCRSSYAVGPRDAGVASSQAPAQVDELAEYISRKYVLNIFTVSSIFSSNYSSSRTIHTKIKLFLLSIINDPKY
jgi:hypothetical protein